MSLRIADFAQKYPPAGPHKPPDTPDQLRELTGADGVLLLTGAPFPQPVSGTPGRREGCHLWVIRAMDLPVVLEAAPRIRPPPLSSGVAKHTNLTGGAPACCGGELWVDAVSANHLYVHGGSGRYWRSGDPLGPQKLADAVGVFEGLGYQVKSAGWDEDNGLPARTFRER